MYGQMRSGGAFEFLPFHRQMEKSEGESKALRCLQVDDSAAISLAGKEDVIASRFFIGRSARPSFDVGDDPAEHDSSSTVDMWDKSCMSGSLW